MHRATQIHFDDDHRCRVGEVGERRGGGERDGGDDGGVDAREQ